MEKVIFIKSLDDAELYDLLPSFSKKALDYIYNEILDNKAIIADIGSGTGRLTKEFLNRGNTVYAVEPDQYMKAVCDRKYSDLSNYNSIVGFAENTNLEDKSVDFVVVSQALHRFNLDKFREELKRILKNEKNVFIFYNRIDFSNNIFGELLQSLKKNYKNYESRYDNKDEVEMGRAEYDSNLGEMCELLQEEVITKKFENDYIIDRETFRNLVLSLGIFPIKNNENLSKTIKEDIDLVQFNEDIDEIFDKYSNDGKIVLPFTTDIHFSKNINYRR